MNPLVGILVLLLLGIAGAKLSLSTWTGRLGPRLLRITGMHMLLVGFVLGSHGVDLLARDLIGRLDPFLALGLGWIGLLFGLQLDRRQLREFPGSYLAIALVQAVVAFLVFLGLGVGLLSLLRERGFMAGGDLVGTAIVAAAATACVSTPAAIALLSDTFQVRGRLTQLLFFIASLDAVVGIAALQINYAVHPPGAAAPGGSLTDVLIVLGGATALGLVLGMLFLLLSRPRPQREELLLFLLGLVVFGAGAALYASLSPLFVCAVAGVVIANVSPIRSRVYQALQEWEKTIYVILLMLAGALLDFPTWLTVSLAVAYIALRVVAKTAAGWIARAVVPVGIATPRGIGLGLVPQGGISIAMAISIMLSYPSVRLGPGSFGGTVFSIVVLGVLGSELLGAITARGVLRRAGELTPRKEAAVVGRGETVVAADFPAPARAPEPEPSVEDGASTTEAEGRQGGGSAGANGGASKGPGVGPGDPLSPPAGDER
ncbi:MAG TPA: cation:proton antiporter [Longimicrobiales bacterium]|nr:cation:proton antiporter [Longimicrobiales bacterium]